MSETTATRPIQLGFGGIVGLAIAAPVLAATAIALLGAVLVLGVIGCVTAIPFVILFCAWEAFDGWISRRRFQRMKTMRGLR